jgi:hypothetical protein
MYESLIAPSVFSNVYLSNHDVSLPYESLCCTLGKSKMDKPEKQATHGTQDQKKQSENTTQYALDTTMR